MPGARCPVETGQDRAGEGHLVGVKRDLYGVSRVLLGFAQSLLMSLTAVFLMETSPKHCRGMMGVSGGLVVQAGAVVGNAVALPDVFGTPERWPWIYATELVLLLVVSLVFGFFMHETPGYLEARGRTDEAIRAIQFYHNAQKFAIDKALEEIHEDLEATSKPISMIQAFRDSSTRRGTLVGCICLLAFVFDGSAAMNSYAVDMLNGAGLDHGHAGLANLGMSLFGVLGLVVALFVVERYGRRPLFISTFGVLALCNVLIALLLFFSLNYDMNWARFLLIFTCAVFMFASSLGPGSLCVFISAELVGQQAKAAASAWAFLAFSIGRAFLVAVYLPLRNLVGDSFAFAILFVLPTIAAVPFFYFWLPETKNKTMAEVRDEIRCLPRLRQKNIFPRPSEQQLRKADSLEKDSINEL